MYNNNEWLGHGRISGNVQEIYFPLTTVGSKDKLFRVPRPLEAPAQHGPKVRNSPELGKYIPFAAWNMA